MRAVHRHRDLEVPTTLAEACQPSRTGLVLYDLQEGILRQIGERDRVLARAAALLQAAREAKVRVVFVRHVTLPVELMGMAQMRLWLSWQRASSPNEVVSPFPPDAPQSQIVREVAPGPGEAVLDKLAMSAFEGTPLAYILRDCGLTTVVLAGVALEIGIEPTARHAADLGFVPVVATDACGAGDAEAGRRTLDALRFAGDALFCEVLELREIWQGTIPQATVGEST
jgi:nicotinamidase-related amidase